MAYQIPPQDNRSFVQDNLTDTGGNLWSSFNIDLTETKGKLQTTRTKLVFSDDDSADLELPFAFAYYNGEHWAATDDFMYQGGGLGSDSYSKDESENDAPDNLIEAVSDITVFNGRLYAIADEDLYWLEGTNWETASYSTGQSPGSYTHLLEPFAQRLYVTDANDKVVHFDDSSTPVLSTSGSGTLDLGLGSDYAISMLESSGDYLWIGVQSLEGQHGFVYQWDGENENTPSNKFKLDSAGVLGGVVRSNENTPTILDVEGKLLKFNGAGFEEVDRLPLENKTLNNSLSNTNTRSMHPNGIIEFEGNIVMLINTELMDGATPERCPSGVWEYSEDNGLYHKYSLSYSEYGDTGTTNLSDYGQVRIAQPGALFETRPDQVGDSSNQPQLLIGAEYRKDNSSTRHYGIWVNDEARTTQELGYIVTPQLFGEGIFDAWQKIYARYRAFADSGDKIIIKTRTRDMEPLEADINWIDTKTFTTTDDISNVEVGYEVEVTQGKGGAYSRHVKEINASSNTYEIVLDEAIDVATGSAKVRFTNWQKQEEITEDYKQWGEVTISEEDVWLQVKLVFIGTGDNELYDLIVRNSEKKGI